MSAQSSAQPSAQSGGQSAGLSSAVPASTRSAALVALAAELGSRAGDARDARRRTALLGLHCLSAFAAKQFRLFEKGFADGSLELDPQFPPAAIVEATICQVAFDIDVFLRILGQRDADDTTAAMRDGLNLADRLAADALAPAVRHGLIEETAVLTYFQKTPTVRLLPYVPLALIGIDLTAIQDPARLLAVAHEVGHHVYRQMTVNYAADLDEQVTDVIAQRVAASAGEQPPAWLLPWAEELFADVYSVLIAGPVAGLSMQAMLMGGSPAHLLHDDGDHPLGALRPQIVVLTLQKLAALDPAAAPRLQNTAARLQDQWRAYLADQKIALAFTPAGGGSSVQLVAAHDQLRRYIDTLLDGPLAPLCHSAKGERWSRGLDAPSASLGELYNQFTAACVRLRGGEAPELAVSDKKVVATPQLSGVKGGQRVVGEIGDPYLDGLRDEALAGKRTLSAGAWKAVFLAGDWVTEEGGSGIRPPE